MKDKVRNNRSKDKSDKKNNKKLNNIGEIPGKLTFSVIINTVAKQKMQNQNSKNAA